jgi:predicted cupin superfamily sugar epimerase
MLTAQEVIDWLKMESNPNEGGYYATTGTSPLNIPNGVLPPIFPPVDGGRSVYSSIYYLIDPASFSAMHKVTGDMVYNYYTGDPVQILLLYPEGYPDRYEIFNFGNDLKSGFLPMKVIPGGAWLGSRMIAGGKYALMGVTLAPGFEPVDYFIGKRAGLVEEYPEVAEMITELTRG